MIFVIQIMYWYEIIRMPGTPEWSFICSIKQLNAQQYWIYIYIDKVFHRIKGFTRIKCWKTFTFYHYGPFCQMNLWSDYEFNINLGALFTNYYYSMWIRWLMYWKLWWENTSIIKLMN